MVFMGIFDCLIDRVLSPIFLTDVRELTFAVFFRTTEAGRRRRNYVHENKSVCHQLLYIKMYDMTGRLECC